MCKKKCMIFLTKSNCQDTMYLILKADLIRVVAIALTIRDVAPLVLDHYIVHKL